MRRTKRSTNPFRRLLGNPRWQFLTIPLFSIVMSMLVISVIAMFIGKNPAAIFISLLQGAGVLPRPNYSAFQSMMTTFFDMLGAYTPMVFAALAVAVAFKSSLFNIGVSGQMLLAGFLATITVGYAPLPAAVARPLVLLIGIAAGMLTGGLIGLLKYQFNINEVVSSIMINYIYQYVIAYFITTGYIDPVTRQSRNIAEVSRLVLKDVMIGGNKFSIPLCLPAAIIIAIIASVYISKSKQGYELRAVGQNAKAAKYAGIRVGWTIVRTMMISGALAGLAGVTYCLGFFSSIRPNTLASLGFDSIAVALVANAHPVGILFSSLLITVLDRGSVYMSSAVGVQQEISSLVTGIILLFSACGAFIRSRFEYTPALSERGDVNG